MPVVGSISTNLSLNEVATLVAPGEGFLTVRGFTTTGFFVVSTLGFWVEVTFGFGVGFEVGFRVAAGLGVTASVDFGPVPLRPSITIFPSWV